jgi:hypothetical protein
VRYGIRHGALFLVPPDDNPAVIARVFIAYLKDSESQVRGRRLRVVWRHN